MSVDAVPQEQLVNRLERHAGSMAMHISNYLVAATDWLVGK